MLMQQKTNKSKTFTTKVLPMILDLSDVLGAHSYSAVSGCLRIATI
jgi:hypothetical protein